MPQRLSPTCACGVVYWYCRKMHCAETVPRMQVIVGPAKHSDVPNFVPAGPSEGFDMIELEPRQCVTTPSVLRDECALTAVSTVHFSPDALEEMTSAFAARPSVVSRLLAFCLCPWRDRKSGGVRRLLAALELRLVECLPQQAPAARSS